MGTRLVLRSDARRAFVDCSLAANNRYAAGLILRLNGLPELSTVMATFPTEPGILKYSASASKEIALSSVQKAPTKKVKETAAEILQESGSLEELHQERFHQANGNGGGDPRVRHHPASTSSGRSRTPGVSSKRKAPPAAAVFSYPSPTRGATSGSLSYKDPLSFSKFASPIGKAPYLPSNLTAFASHPSAAAATQRNSLVVLESGGGGSDVYASERKQLVKEERQSLLFETYGVQSAALAMESSSTAHGIKRKQLKTHLVSAAETTWATPIVSPKTLLRNEMLAGPSQYVRHTGAYAPVRSRGYEATECEDALMQQAYHFHQQQAHRSELSPSSRKQQTAKKMKTKRPASFQVSVESSTQLRISKEMHSPFAVPRSPTHKRSKSSAKGAAAGGTARYATAKSAMSGQRAAAGGQTQRPYRSDSNASTGESLTAYAAKLFNDDFGFDTGELNGGGAELQRTSVHLLTAREQAEIQERERLSFAEKLHKMIDKAKSTLAASNVSAEPVGARSSQSTTSALRSARPAVATSSPHVSSPKRATDTAPSAATEPPRPTAAAVKKTRVLSDGTPRRKAKEALADEPNASSSSSGAVAVSAVSNQPRAAPSHDTRKQIGSKPVASTTKRPLASLPAAPTPAARATAASFVSSTPRSSKQPLKPAASKPKTVLSAASAKENAVPYATPVESSPVSSAETKTEAAEEITAVERVEAATEASSVEQNAAQSVSIETPDIPQVPSATADASAVSEPEPHEKLESLPTVEEDTAVAECEQQSSPVASESSRTPLEEAPEQVETSPALDGVIDDAKSKDGTAADRIATPDSETAVAGGVVEAPGAESSSAESAVEQVAASPPDIEPCEHTETENALDSANAHSASVAADSAERPEASEPAEMEDQANPDNRDDTPPTNLVEDTPSPEAAPTDDMYADEYNDFDDDAAEDEASPENLDDLIEDQAGHGIPLDELLSLANQVGAGGTDPSSGADENGSVAAPADEQSLEQAAAASKSGDDLYANDDSASAIGGQDGALIDSEDAGASTDAATAELSPEGAESAASEERAVGSIEIPGAAVEAQTNSVDAQLSVDAAETRANDVSSLDEEAQPLPDAEEGDAVDTPASPEESAASEAIDTGSEAMAEPDPVAGAAEVAPVESAGMSVDDAPSVEEPVHADDISTEPERVADRPESRGADSYADDGFDFDPEEGALDTGDEVLAPGPSDESALAASSLAAEGDGQSDQAEDGSVQVEVPSDMSTADETSVEQPEMVEAKADQEEPVSSETEGGHRGNDAEVVDGGSDPGTEGEVESPGATVKPEDGASSDAQYAKDEQSNPSAEEGEIVVTESGEASEVQDASEVATSPLPEPTEASDAAPSLDATRESENPTPSTEDAVSDEAPAVEVEATADAPSTFPDNGSSAEAATGDTDGYDDDDYEASFEDPEVASARVQVAVVDASGTTDTDELAGSGVGSTSEDVAQLCVPVEESVESVESAGGDEPSEDGSEVAVEQVGDTGVEPPRETETSQTSNSAESVVEPAIEAAVSVSSDDVVPVPGEGGDSSIETRREPETVQDRGQDEPPSSDPSASEPSLAPEVAGDEIEQGVRPGADTIDVQTPDDSAALADDAEPASGSLDTTKSNEADTTGGEVVDSALDPSSLTTEGSGAEANPTEAVVGAGSESEIAPDELIPAALTEEEATPAVESAEEEVVETDAEKSGDNYDNEFEYDAEVAQVDDKVEDTAGSTDPVATENENTTADVEPSSVDVSEPMETAVQAVLEPHSSDHADPVIDASSIEDAMVEAPVEAAVEAELVEEEPAMETPPARDESGVATHEAEPSLRPNDEEAVQDPESLAADEPVVRSPEVSEGSIVAADADKATNEPVNEASSSAEFSSQVEEESGAEERVVSSNDDKRDDELLYEDEYEEDADHADLESPNDATASEVSSPPESDAPLVVATKSESAEITGVDGSESLAVAVSAAETSNEGVDTPEDAPAGALDALTDKNAQADPETASPEDSESVPVLHDAEGIEGVAQDATSSGDVGATVDEEENGYDDDGEFEEGDAAPPVDEVVPDDPAADSAATEPVGTQETEVETTAGGVNASIVQVEPSPQEPADSADNVADASPASLSDAGGDGDQSRADKPEVEASVAAGMEGDDHKQNEDRDPPGSVPVSPEASVPGSEESPPPSEEQLLPLEELFVHESVDERAVDDAQVSGRLGDPPGGADSQPEAVESTSEVDMPAEANELPSLVETEPEATAPRDAEPERGVEVADSDAAPNADAAAETTEEVDVEEAPVVETGSASEAHQSPSTEFEAYDEFEAQEEADAVELQSSLPASSSSEIEVAQDVQSDEQVESVAEVEDAGVSEFVVDANPGSEPKAVLADEKEPINLVDDGASEDAAEPTESTEPSADQAEVNRDEVESPEESIPSHPNNDDEPASGSLAASTPTEDEPAQTGSSTLAPDEVAVTESDSSVGADTSSAQQDLAEGKAVKTARLQTDESAADPRTEAEGESVASPGHEQEEPESTHGELPAGDNKSSREESATQEAPANDLLLPNDVPPADAESRSEGQTDDAAVEVAVTAETEPESEAVADLDTVQADEYDEFDTEVEAVATDAADGTVAPASPETDGYDDFEPELPDPLMEVQPAGESPTTLNAGEDGGTPLGSDVYDAFEGEDDESAPPAAAESPESAPAAPSVTPVSSEEPPVADDDYADEGDDYNDFGDEQAEVEQPPATSSTPSAVVSTDSTPREVDDDDVAGEPAAQAAPAPSAASSAPKASADVDDEDEYAVEDEFEDDDKPTSASVAAPASASAAASEPPAAAPDDAENEYEADYDDAEYDDFDE